MSRIINFRRHFDSIIEGLMYRYRTTQFFCAQNLEVIPELRVGNIEKEVRKRVSELVLTIMDLQIYSFYSQYSSHSDLPSKQLIKEQREEMHREESPDPLELKDPICLYKAMSCAIYQIEPEDIEKIHPLSEKEKNAIKFFKYLLHHLAESIILQLPEYDKADWAIE